MELTQLQDFMEASKRGRFRRAAEALFTTQPSASARIKAMETEMGVPFFHRTLRGVRLTDIAGNRREANQSNSIPSPISPHDPPASIPESTVWK